MDLAYFMYNSTSTEFCIHYLHILTPRGQRGEAGGSGFASDEGSDCLNDGIVVWRMLCQQIWVGCYPHQHVVHDLPQFTNQGSRVM